MSITPWRNYAIWEKIIDKLWFNNGFYYNLVDLNLRD